MAQTQTRARTKPAATQSGGGRRAGTATAAKARPAKAKSPAAGRASHSPPRKAKSGTDRRSGRSGRSGRSKATGGAGAALELFTPSRRSTVMATLAKRAISTVAPDLPDIDADRLAELVQRAVAEGRKLIAGTGALRPELPIQRAIDVAVPLRVAWDEWMRLELLPEGVGDVQGIERDGTELVGEMAGTRRGEWRADILDKRPEESFAWRSTAGSDCAGLVTFHGLAKRLTRVELNLDIVPTSPADTLMLTTRLADRRAQSALRRFKARVEVISPDAYEDGDRPRRR